MNRLWKRFILGNYYGINNKCIMVSRLTAIKVERAKKAEK